ncbi:unnamed protein product [Cladocopium goreaui]|uniref:OVARIAN TUMOR DOMAIN-containing deubiquitinating enzyme 10 (OTU domain-containing protein 10) (Deubiquitinating enzyme OTU10) n=1 Tax=Cladocopium goreaui TaxID=2562237 RepID=A0A9P1BLT4_9DINO|nr:unnamed protein product [Cladocopium goreaui]
MGQCSTQDAVGPQLQLRGDSGNSFASVDLASRFQDGAKEDTFVVNSRQVDLEVVRNQRAEAAVASSNMSQMVRRNTRTALQEQSEGRGSLFSSSEMRTGFQRISTSLRMSRMGTMKRNQMIEDVTEAAPKEGLQGASLEQRLQTFGMQMVEMAGDGNCQFRTIAFNLFRSQDHHAAPRRAAVAHMKKHADFFGVFFEDEAEFQKYLKNMSISGTWGDELTLRAVVEAYGCIAHVVTSEPKNWHLVYEPENTEVDPAIAVCPKGMDMPKPRKQIFLAYISPIHYNAIVARKAG